MIDFIDLIMPIRLTTPQFMHQCLALLLIVSTAVTIWSTLVLATGSESPIVVVLRSVRDSRLSDCFALCPEVILYLLRSATETFY